MPESATQPRHGLRDPETINRESSRWIRAEAFEEGILERIPHHQITVMPSGKAAAGATALPPPRPRPQQQPQAIHVQYWLLEPLSDHTR
jgi:hypothetical protein